jgi:hypothetical protein
MKLRRLNRLNKGAVGRASDVEKVTTLSAEELKTVLGGVQIAAEAHAHYNYSECSSSCGSLSQPGDSGT